MSNQVTLRSSTQSLPRTILITSNEDPSKQADLVGGLISIAYFESILSDTLGTITFTDTGINSQWYQREYIRGLPIVGQEKFY